MNLEACLPPNLRTPSTTITRVAAGLSGASVFRVEADGRAFVLKISNESTDAWRRKLGIQQLAVSAGLAPEIIHVDEERRAILSVFVEDRSFFALYGNPASRDAAITLLARTLRRTHELPLPSDAIGRPPLALLDELGRALTAFALPAFVDDAIQRMHAERVPAADRLVLSHNDVNPTNLVYDGERLLFFDWDTAGPNDPFFDLAAIAVFLRMDDATCCALLSAYAEDATTALPARFVYDQRLVAVSCGAAFLYLARQAGHGGATGAETLDTAPTLAELYPRLRTGQLSLASPEGRWQFGLALIKAGVIEKRTSPPYTDP